MKGLSGTVSTNERKEIGRLVKDRIPSSMSNIAHVRVHRTCVYCAPASPGLWYKCFKCVDIVSYIRHGDDCECLIGLNFFTVQLLELTKVIPMSGSAQNFKSQLQQLLFLD